MSNEKIGSPDGSTTGNVHQHPEVHKPQADSVEVTRTEVVWVSPRPEYQYLQRKGLTRQFRLNIVVDVLIEDSVDGVARTQKVEWPYSTIRAKTQMVLSDWEFTEVWDGGPLVTTSDWSRLKKMSDEITDGMALAGGFALSRATHTSVDGRMYPMEDATAEDLEVRAFLTPIPAEAVMVSVYSREDR